MLSEAKPVFVSYARKDKKWLDRLMVHLKPLERAGKIIAWADTCIHAGEDWRTEVETALENAQVAILLVSADFLASDFIAKNELPPLLTAAKTKGLIIIPIIVKPCLYEKISALASLQSINPPSKPLIRLREVDRENYFVKLSIQIEGLCVKTRDPSTFTEPKGLAPLPAARPMPYSGLRHTTRSSAGKLREVTSNDVGKNVSLFAETGKQWVLIIGTEPKAWGDNPAGVSTEFFDASDILDWFWSPDIYGAIPTNQLYFLVGEAATSDSVIWALTDISQHVQAADSVLLYYSGHATEFSEPGELVLYDAFEGNTWGQVTKETRGLLSANYLMNWCNRLSAEKVVCILDAGGPACYKAADFLSAGRYVISALNSRIGGRNGYITWYIRRTVQKFGRNTTIAQLFEILQQAGELLDKPLHVYLRGSDSTPRAV